MEYISKAVAIKPNVQAFPIGSPKSFILGTEEDKEALSSIWQILHLLKIQHVLCLAYPFLGQCHV